MTNSLAVVAKVFSNALIFLQQNFSQQKISMDLHISNSDFTLATNFVKF